MKPFVPNLSYVAMKRFFLFEFLLRTSIRTPEAENLQKNKHIQPQPKFRCSNKKKTCIVKACYQENVDGIVMREWIVNAVFGFHRELHQ